jgi:hypothetical protein
MTNHEHPSESEHGQPDQADRPYSELGFFTQTYLEYIATGRFDPSTYSTEELRVLDSVAAKMYADFKYLIDHGELPPNAGPPPEFLQRLEKDDHNDTPPPPPDTPQ